MTAPILVVDDDPKIVSLVKTYLEREGFRVITAQDGRSALSAYNAYHPGLIVLDLMLPELDGLALMRIVRERVAQVLANLLQNASRYTPRGGRASVRAESGRTGAIVTITNSGGGIPAADLPHVFERFYRVEKSRDAARGGAGIGLAIVKQLVEASGGKVGVESTDHTTRFWFSLPLT